MLTRRGWNSSEWKDSVIRQITAAIMLVYEGRGKFCRGLRQILFGLGSGTRHDGVACFDVAYALRHVRRQTRMTVCCL
jgi:hypothetical protein